jgi:hypothetical protein
MVVGDPQTENLGQHNSNHVGILTNVSIEVTVRGAQWAFGSALGFH